MPLATERTNNEIINKFNIGSKHLLSAKLKTDSLFQTAKSTQAANEKEVNHSRNVSDNGSVPSADTLIQLILSTLDVTAAVDESNNSNISDQAADGVPSFNGVLDLLKATQNIFLDNEQQMAYEIICSTFLLKLINDSGDEFDDSDDLSSGDALSKVTKVVNKDVKCQHNNVISRLCAYGGKRNSLCSSRGQLAQAKALQFRLQNNSVCNSASTQKSLG